MKNDIIILAIATLLLLLFLIFFARMKYKKLKKMSNEERERVANEKLDKAGWLTIIKNILKLFVS